jgi:hypothetical protein
MLRVRRMTATMIAAIAAKARDSMNKNIALTGSSTLFIGIPIVSDHGVVDLPEQWLNGKRYLPAELTLA